MTKTNVKEAREVLNAIIDKLDRVIKVTPDEGRIVKIYGGEIKESYKNERSAASCNALLISDIRKSIKYGRRFKGSLYEYNTEVEEC